MRTIVVTLFVMATLSLGAGDANAEAHHASSDKMECLHQAPADTHACCTTIHGPCDHGADPLSPHPEECENCTSCSLAAPRNDSSPPLNTDRRRVENQEVEIAPVYRNRDPVQLIISSCTAENGPPGSLSILQSTGSLLL